MRLVVLMCLSWFVGATFAGGSAPGITSTSLTNKMSTIPTPKAPPYCDNGTNHTGDIAFKTIPPTLTRVKEGAEFELDCSYCLGRKANSTLNWYNRHGEIVNNDKHTISGDGLVVPKANADVDEGWFSCVVRTSVHNISALFTVIVDKAERDPILTSVEARNMTSTSVLIQWTLQRHALYVITRVRLHVRKLTSKQWTHNVDKITKKTDLYLIENLEPGTVYVLHVEIIINTIMEESKTMVFNTAPANYTFAHNKTKVIYHATSREATGIALGIVAFMACLFGFCACYSWCYNDKKDYVTPTNQHWEDEYFHREPLYHENNSLCNTGVHYNRAYEKAADDDWNLPTDEPL